MTLIRISLAYLIEIISWIIVIKSLFTWVPSLMGTKLFRIMVELTDPIEEPIRRVLNRYYNGPVDFSPLVAIIILAFLRGIIL